MTLAFPVHQFAEFERQPEAPVEQSLNSSVAEGEQIVADVPPAQEVPVVSVPLDPPTKMFV